MTGQSVSIIITLVVGQERQEIHRVCVSKVRSQEERTKKRKFQYNKFLRENVRKELPMTQSVTISITSQAGDGQPETVQHAIRTEHFEEDMKELIRKVTQTAGVQALEGLRQI